MAVAPQVTTSARGTTVPVGCRLSSGTVRRCDIVLTARRNGRQVVIGTGSKTFTGAAARASVQVPVRLNATGRRLSARPAGIKARVAATIWPTGQTAALTDTATTLLTRPHTVTARGKILFDFDSAKLRPAGKRYLARLRHRLPAIDDLLCVGHTDSVGAASYNQRLGRRRARAACRFLARGTGWDTRAVSHGERTPAASNATARGRQLNRRAVVHITF
ncbi:OmpA family protein [Planomonospora algeriensis]